MVIPLLLTFNVRLIGFFFLLTRQDTLVSQHQASRCEAHRCGSSGCCMALLVHRSRSH